MKRCFVVLFFYSMCSVTMAAESAATQLSPDEALLQAHSKYQHWSSAGKKRDGNDLLEAELLYGIASKKHRYDSGLQINRYLVRYALAWSDWGAWGEKLKASYVSLGPMLKPQINHPGVLELVNLSAKSKGELRVAQLELFQTMLRDRPTSGHSWYLFSKFFEGIEEYELALEAAKLSAKLVDDSAELNFQIANLYYFLWEGHSCDKDGRGYAVRAIPYFVKASTLMPDNSFLANRLSHIYKVLGVFPMAIEVGEKALALEENPYTLRDLAEAAMLDGQYPRAEKHYQRLAGKHKESNYYYQLAKIDLANADVIGFKMNYRRAVKKHTANLTQRITHYELLKKFDQRAALRFFKEHSRYFNFYTSWGQDAWSKQTTDYMADVISTSEYFEKAANDCEKGKAYFYHALDLWGKNENKKAVCALKRSKSLSSILSDEYDWAQVLIDGKMVLPQTPDCGELATLQRAVEKNEHPVTVDDFLWALNNAENFYGDISQKVYFQPNPKYPLSANNSGTKGYAVVEVGINAGGLVESVKLREELPEGVGFGPAAIEAARKLRFYPRVEKGKAVPVKAHVFKYSFTGFVD